MKSGGHEFEYLIHIRTNRPSHEKPRIVRENATCDGRILFERDLEGVRFPRAAGPTSGFPLDWWAGGAGLHPAERQSS